MRSLRRRVQMSKLAIQAGQHPTLGMPIDYRGTGEAQADVSAAGKRAQELTDWGATEVNVYHSIAPSNSSNKRAVRPLGDILTFLVQNRSPKEEISVSVKKGLWDAGMVLVGSTRELVAYWPTDVHTKPVPGNPRMKIPLDAKRPPDFRPYDEALVELGKVRWHTLYIDSNSKSVADLGGPIQVQKVARMFGLAVKKIDQGSADDPMVRTRYESQAAIQKYTKYNTYLHQHILRLADQAESQPYSPEIVQKLTQIKDDLGNKDPTHQDLIKYPAKRASALQTMFNWLKQIYDFIVSLVGLGEQYGRPDIENATSPRT